MNATDERRAKEAVALPKPFMRAFVAGLILTILFCAWLVGSQRNRIDATVIVWGSVLIAGIMILSIPIAIWQQNAKRRPLPCPWPEPDANPLFGQPIHAANLRLSGRFIWTKGTFRRMAKAWVRYTPAGRRYRRTIT